MPKPLVVFANPIESIVDYLTARLAGRSEPYVQGVQIGAWVPTDSSPEAPGLPFVQVVSDGAPNTPYPVTMRDTVRAVVWHSNPSPAYSLASLVFGLLAVHPGDDRVFSVRTVSGPLAAVDGRTGANLSSVVVRVSLRPSELSL